MPYEENVIQLPDGRFEQKIQVDRRKLEQMIVGRTAFQFFHNVFLVSSAQIVWPEQLKIGAKTKKDPFVKAIGTFDQIETARNMILNNLQVKKERVSLKMELHHSIHSHIIGKGGRGIQMVMKATNCHIHFPDSNKYSDANKSDQVSISGTALNVYMAQRHLRSMCPLTIFLDLPWFSQGQPDFRNLVSQIDVSIVSVDQNVYSLMLKLSSNQDASALFAIRMVVRYFGLADDYINIRTNLSTKDELSFQNNEIQENCAKLGVTVHPGSENVSIFGPPAGVLKIRKMLLGRSQIIVNFDCNLMEVQYPIRQLEVELGLQVMTKRKNNETVTIFIRSVESKLAEVLKSREVLLALPPTNFPDEDFENSPASTSSYSNTPPNLAPLQQLSESSISLFSTPPLESPKSPDPEDSPLAASILKGAKELWKKEKPKADRGEMLIKATQAIFDDSVLSQPRYPTDLWSGYGFSCSLPAELLKGMMDLSTSETTVQQNETEMGSSNFNINRGLCSLREEDEMSDFSASSFNYTNGSKVFDTRPPPQARNFFSASTSAFDSSTLPYDIRWDINHFTDPSMVLAQLGCSEYLTQLRDQEIDMHAFLLLDEQNLKDIGVSTIGARKKIHHAILKLRDSARLNGYAV